MKHLFIINPAAGTYDHTHEFAEKIKAVMGDKDYTIHTSRGPGDCTAAARKAGESGEAVRIYACGGDGTLNEVVNGAAGFSNVAVTHYPGGSGNDFIKIFSDPKKFFDLEALQDPEERTFDLIEAADTLCLDICSMGFDARIGTEIGKYKRLPLVSGSGAYKISVVANLIKGVHHHYRLELDGQELDGRFSMICVCNGRFYGGGFQPVPEAMPDDGKLEVLLTKAVSRLKVAGIVGKYQKGQYRDFPELFTRYSTDRVVVHCDKEEVINLDGEARYGQDVEIRLSDKKLRFFYPKGLTY